MRSLKTPMARKCLELEKIGTEQSLEAVSYTHLSNMVLECKAPVNIMFADTKDIDGKAYGQMILQLPEDERAAKRALAYLETQNVHVEEGDAHAFT